MQEHRIRLTDDDIDLIVAALASRRADAGTARQVRIDRLIARLSDGNSGNPNWRLGTEYPQLP